MPPGTGTDVGIAEFSHANFFSDDTIPGISDTDIASPTTSGLGQVERTYQGKTRRYWERERPGFGFRLLAAVSAIEDHVGTLGADKPLDDLVFEDYAAELFPRAIGYSAAVIDYFFRGRIDLVPDSSNPGPDPRNPSRFLIRNLGDEELSGEFEIYYDDVDDRRHPIPPVHSTTLAPRGQSGDTLPVEFTPPTSPAPRTPGEYTLVFQGRMGREAPLATTGQVAAHQPLAGVIRTSGGDALGRAEPGNAGAVHLEAGADLGSLPAATEALEVAEGETRIENGEKSFTSIRIDGTLVLEGPTTLNSHGPVTISGAVITEGADLVIHSLGRVSITGEIDASGLDGADFGPAPQGGADGGSVVLRSASPFALVVPTIIARGGNADRTTAADAASGFAAGDGGSVTIVTRGNEVVFSGSKLGSSEVDPIPSGGHNPSALSSQTFGRGILTTGGYGGVADETLADGSGGGASGAIRISCEQESPLRFVETSLFTGGDVERNVQYSTQIVNTNGQTPSTQLLSQPTGSLGGRGFPGNQTDGGWGGPGGAGGDIEIAGACTLDPAPATYRNAGNTNFTRSGVDPRATLPTSQKFRRAATVEALDAQGNILFRLKPYGGGGGIPGGSNKSTARCSGVTQQPCFTNNQGTCPLGETCIAVGTAGDPGRFGTLGLDGLVSCDAFGIPAQFRADPALAPEWRLSLSCQ